MRGESGSIVKERAAMVAEVFRHWKDDESGRQMQARRRQAEADTGANRNIGSYFAHVDGAPLVDR